MNRYLRSAVAIAGKCVVLCTMLAIITPPAHAEFCVDTDAGNNLAKKGTLQYLDTPLAQQKKPPVTLVDSCVGNTLQEYVCLITGSTGKDIPVKSNTTGKMAKYAVPCAGSCVDGACTAAPPPQPVAYSCIDSDGGYTLDKKGTTEVVSANTNGVKRLFTDSCSTDGKTVNESYCYVDGAGGGYVASNNTGRYGENIAQCLYGCNAGACYLYPAGCFDSDPTGVSQTPAREFVQIAQNNITRTVTQSVKKYQCDTVGRKAIRYSCGATGAFIAATPQACDYGCLDGACIASSVDNEGCFIKLVVEETPSADKKSSLFTYKKLFNVVGKYFGALRLTAIEGDTGITLETYGANKVGLQKYSLRPGIYGLAEDFQGNAELIVQPKVTREIYVPFSGALSGVRIISAGKTLDIPLPESARICVRPCITTNEAASTTITDQKCCPGTTPKFFNPTTFVCRACGITGASPCPSASPSPTPS